MVWGGESFISPSFISSPGAFISPEIGRAHFLLRFSAFPGLILESHPCQREAVAWFASVCQQQSCPLLTLAVPECTIEESLTYEDNLGIIVVVSNKGSLVRPFHTGRHPRHVAGSTAQESWREIVEHQVWVSAAGACGSS